MKNTFKIVSLTLILSVVFSCLVFGEFTDKSTEKYRTEKEAVEFIETLANKISAQSNYKVVGTKITQSDFTSELVKEQITELDPDYTKYTVVGSIKLNGFTGEKSYVMYLLSPGGYAVYDEISGVAEEIMPGAENPFEDVKEGELYYGGPMNFIIKVNGTFYLAEDNSELSAEDVDGITELELQSIVKQNDVKGLPTETTDYSMTNSSYFTTLLNDHFGAVSSYSYEQTACDIMLGFYDWYVNDQFVPTAYHYKNPDNTKGYGTKFTDDEVSQAFVNVLKFYMGTGYISLTSAQSGLNSYFSDIFFTTPTACTVTGSSSVYQRVKNDVFNNKPTVIVLTASHNPSSTSYNRAVVAYAYSETLVGGVFDSAYYYVHTGEKGSGQIGTFSYAWFNGGLYIS